MNSSFGTTVARRRRPHFRHSLASGPLTDQLCTSRFGERGISTPTCWGLLKQPDNQKSPRNFPSVLQDHVPQQRRLPTPFSGPTRRQLFHIAEHHNWDCATFPMYEAANRNTFLKPDLCKNAFAKLRLLHIRSRRVESGCRAGTPVCVRGPKCCRN